MSTKSVQTRKKSGRPPLLVDSERELVAKLYFDLEWTARQIREQMFPALSDDSIRAMAKRVRGVTKTGRALEAGVSLQN